MKILYIGTGEIGVPTLKSLIENDNIELIGVVTQPDRPVGRKQELTPSPIKQTALQHQLRIFQPDSINSETALTQLAYLQPDLIIVFAYGQILKPAVLNLPPKGCINIHASLLPKYRGAACIQAAIKNGDPETGITIIWMNEGLDTGDILTSQKLSIHPHETAGELHDRLADFSPHTLTTALDLIQKGEAPHTPQDNEKASYIGLLKKEDGWINWNQPASAIARHIRAMSPWPSAFTTITIKGRKLKMKLHSASPNPAPSEHALPPGTILNTENNALTIACQNSTITIHQIQIEGRKRMTIDQCLCGTPLTGKLG